MDPKFQQQLDDQELQIAEILASVKKTEKYMRMTFWITVIVVVVPAILLSIALPAMISSYTATLEGLL